MAVEILNESGIEVPEDALLRMARHVYARLHVHERAETAVTVVDAARMAELHEEWMDLPGPTDVMSFPMDELTPGGGRPDADMPGPAMLGDIILCPAYDRKQAEMAGHDLAHEMALLTVHGVLHLLGYDHIEPKDEREMFALQNEILADWYDDLARRGVEYQPKPTGAHAFPSAADRDELDKLMKGTE